MHSIVTGKMKQNTNQKVADKQNIRESTGDRKTETGVKATQK